MDREADFYKAILDNLSDGVYFVDAQRRITYWNKGAERITGFLSAQVVGSSCADNILMHVREDGTNLCQMGCPLARSLSCGETVEAEVFLHHSHGHRVPIRVRTAVLRDASGAIVGGVEVFSDNSAVHAALRHIGELRKTVMLDPLTGLGNRRYVEMKVQTYLSEFHEHGVPFGVLFLDIDHFKRVNDAHGHDIGDRVLKMVAETLQHSIRSTDVSGRWGGEEFIVLLASVDANDVLAIAEKARALISSSRFPVQRDPIAVTVSVGATMSRDDDAAETLLKRADRLMYESKERGRNAVSFSP